MTSVLFGSKAETLARLCSRVTRCQVQPPLLFTVGEWLQDPGSVIGKIQAAFSKTEAIAVRSSVQGEDSPESSHAGEFQSVLNVSIESADAIRTAIDTVIDSYPDRSPSNQFFCQKMVTSIRISGVALSSDVTSGSPYITINYDDVSATSNSVTSGRSNNLKAYVRFRGSPNPPPTVELRLIVDAIAELEALLSCDHLDVEFAIDDQLQLHLLQVRPMVLTRGRHIMSEQILGSALGKVHSKIAKLNKPHPGTDGKKALFSVMSDWNPAEMIGVKPKMLALSLYKELLTDSVWAYQRDNYGYRNLRSFPLLISFLGAPYIDVRASFNSFVPKTLDDKLAERLVDYYIDRLSENPADHDKVEFNIVFSCYYLNLNARLKTLLAHGFSELELDRIKFALLNLTNSIISPGSGLYQKDIARVNVLESRFSTIMESDLSQVDKLYWLTEDCKRYGTLPFAGLARAGFIAIQFLRSFVELGIMTPAEMDQYMNSLNSIAHQISADTRQMRAGELSREDFLSKYGHLRPGTYDILSPRYDENFAVYFRGTEPGSEAEAQPVFEFRDEQKERIADSLRENGIQCSLEQLLAFLKDAIEGREWSKFVFTRSLSAILQLLGNWGESLGVKKEELAYLDFRCVLSLYASQEHRDVADMFRENIQRNQEAYEFTKALKVPQLIRNQSEVYDFFHSQVEPNFVTQLRVLSDVVLESKLTTEELRGKIIFIRSADPGFDWLFSRDIGGLVTMYGGANSHMAIRCAELQIPAVLGCGDRFFETWSRSKVLELDALNKSVRIIS